MGQGAWNPNVYASVTQTNISRGTQMAYNRQTKSAPQSAWKASGKLDPIQLAGPGSPVEGKNIRESRDSDDHPLSLPLVVGFDQTGSMGDIPITLQTKLAELFGVLLRKGYVEDPQIAISAYGDAMNHERVPLQFAQFESDNRIDDCLNDLFLEGNGGGNGGETGSLIWYFAGKHTITDSWEKRGKKGYLFTIGDEIMHTVPSRVIKDLVGDTVPVDIEGDLTPEMARDIAREQWDVYHLIINNTSAHYQESVKFYTDLLGNNAIILEDAKAVCETIAMIVGLAEGVVDVDTAADDLKSLGADAGAVLSASKAVAKLGNGHMQKKTGVVAQAEAPAGLNDDDDDVARV